MKRKTNISVLDNMGNKQVVSMLVSNKFNGYTSGDILDANAIVELVKQLIKELGGILPDSITSLDIQDGTIQLEDLSEEVTDKLDSEYEEGGEVLYLNGSRSNN